MTTPLWKSSPYRGNRRSGQTPLPRKPENGAVHSPSLYLFVLIATIGVVAYTAFLLNPSNRGDWLPYSLVISAELILVTKEQGMEGARDLAEPIRDRVLERLTALGAEDDVLKPVREYHELEAAQEGQALGDALPIGLRLRTETAVDEP